MYRCPFGAVIDKSFIVSAVETLKKGGRIDPNSNRRVYAVVAPSISGRFTYAKPGRVITGMKQPGFHDAVSIL